jgi:hypothetical protein
MWQGKDERGVSKDRVSGKFDSERKFDPKR